MCIGVWSPFFTGTDSHNLVRGKKTSSVVIPCLQATTASPLPSTLSTAGRDLPTKQLSKGMISSPAAVLVPGFLLTKQQAFESWKSPVAFCKGEEALS